jgi:dipeptidyl-peptidase 4
MFALPAGAATAQELTVERIFSGAMTAVAPEVSFMPDGRGLASLVRNGSLLDVWVERAGTTQAERVIDATTLIPVDEEGPIRIEEVSWSDDGQRALIFTDSKRVWRVNTKGRYYVWDRRSGRLVPASKIDGLQQYAKFSPDGAQVGFVRDNDLFVSDPASGRELRITRDGGDDIINGAADWVYEEEFDLRDGFRWSPDGTRIAYWRFDQSEIRPFYLVDETTLYPTLVPVRYPKAGTPNSTVELHVADIATGRNIRIDTGSNPESYIVRMDWIDAGSIAVQRLDRAQHRIDVLLVDAATGRSRPLFAETDSAWVNVDDDMVWIRRGRQFLWTSERTGWNQIFLFNRDGSIARQITRGDRDVVAIVGMDESAGRVFFTANEPGPMEKQLFSIGLDGRGLRRISTEPGTHDITMAPGARFYIDTWSRAGVAPVVRLHSADGRPIRTLADNATLAASLESLGDVRPEFFTFEASDGTPLDGWMIKPPDFDPSRKYPVLLYVYGGPGSQTVTDAWAGPRYLWHLLLARRGIVVASIDNRGTGGRGRAFRRITYRNLGEWETRDQVDAARYIGALPWGDPQRIGIWGWSYGGYMTALSMINSNVFRAGIAVAPVTDWHLYDTAYTERYMGSPDDNPEGYDRSSPLPNAARLSGRIFLIHGTGDDNVHFQNTVRFSDALQAAGKSFDLMIYANRTHSLSGGTTSEHLFNAMTDWLDRYLVGGR